ncbi:Disease resistance protein [Abeliophyllum distichum]|uniref:Disease resistance protein n=1 Tax=Abeliophyllum distichum TaxID=126358 RepID=A0ABD1UF65_9LAMI
MEIVTSVISSLLAEPCRLLFNSIDAKIRNYFNFKSNLKDLDKAVEGLIQRRDSINQDLEVAARAGLLPRPEIREWLRRVNKMEIEVNSMKTDMVGSCSFSFRWCQFKCCMLPERAQEYLFETKELIDACHFPAGVATENPFPVTVEYIPAPSIDDQETAAKNIAKIMDLLSNSEVKRIGVWGMGGVGKTTLVKNINNKLNDPSLLSESFSIIIWITVSNKSQETESELKRVQKQIAERLNLVLNEDSVEKRAITLHKRLKMEEKFLLILDDVWDPIDLDDLGIPQPEIHEGSKIMLTTRFSEVCGAMRTDVILKIEVLKEEEAWKLFCRSAGEVATQENVEPLAWAVARECGGLPLAINVVGACLRGKKIVELWEDALNMLRRSEPLIRGIEDKVYNPLKWSYDLLPSERIKSCFLFCCLFPEDYSIDVHRLVRYWSAEGLLELHHNYEEIMNRGMAIIECLKDSCLLEEDVKSTVKMHDVVRDVAVWISSSSNVELKSLVRSGIGLRRIRQDEILTLHRRVSFMCNEIYELPNAVTQCPSVSTLLLQGNRNLVRIPDEFLQSFLSLKILDLSGCRLVSLPLCLDQLVELRALLLDGCNHLQELPPLGGLAKLQVLDCSGTNITSLPEGMELLTSLRLLNLSYIKRLVTIPAGAMSRLCNLEYLNMRRNANEWDLRPKAREGLAPLEEIVFLERLAIWYVDLDSNLSNLETTDTLLNGIKKLKKFDISIGFYPRSIDMLEGHTQRRVILNGLRLSGEWIAWLFINSTSVHIYGCEGINYMFAKLGMNSGAVGCFDSLKTLDISHSMSSLKPSVGNAAQFDLLPNLEQLYLRDLDRLSCISEFSMHLGLRFAKLRFIRVERCPRMKYLLTLETAVPALEKLQEISISSCGEAAELFRCLVQDSVFPNLQTIRLSNCWKLETLCRGNGAYPRLKKVEVINCPLLKKLPRTVQNASTIQEE